MTDGKFPEGFVWGVATSAHQIEGAWDIEGKGRSIWNEFEAGPGNILDGSNANLAIDHFNRYKEDIALLKSLNIPAYGFSISWPRIFPAGKGQVNQKGLDFYDRLIDEMLNHEIKPKATLFHWDLPMALFDVGGWLNRDTTKYFADYAKTVFEKYSDRVNLWATINEPWVVAFLGHQLGVHAPGHRNYFDACQVAHHLLLAHGRATQVFRDLSINGEIGITLNLNGLQPGSDSEEDLQAQKRVFSERHSLFLDPLYKAKIPNDLFNYVGQAPEIHANDLSIISIKTDYLGVNHYNSDYVFHKQGGGILDVEMTPIAKSGWGKTEMGWGVYPAGFENELLDLRDHYGNPNVIISENGAAFVDEAAPDGFVDDRERIRYLRSHIAKLHSAIQKGCNVSGYFLWSAFDNFEWERGYGPRFGIIRVNFETLERSPKNSAKWYSELIKANRLD